MFFALKVAMRFLKEGKIQTILILIGIAVGVAVQIFLSSLISGLQISLIQQTVGNASHITVKPRQTELVSAIQKPGVLIDTKISNSNLQEVRLSNWNRIFNGLKNQNEIINVSPFLDGAGFAQKGQKSLPVIIRGTMFDQSDGIYKVKERKISGISRIGGNEIMIGTTLADDLNISAGDIIRLMTSGGQQELFTVAGTFDLQNQSINKSWVLMDLNRAQKFFTAIGDITSIEIQISNVFKANDMAEKLRSFYQDVSFETWQENNKQLLSAISSQSSSSNVIQFFVVMAVALGISSVLAVSVMQKSKQIGILKAMGANNIIISQIFLFQGAILGFAGSIVGSGIGIALIESFLYFTDKSGNSIFPILISKDILLFSVAVATFVGTTAALFPALNSIKLNPIEVIRNG
jgi:lipoprotein-releasing system permease protein